MRFVNRWALLFWISLLIYGCDFVDKASYCDRGYRNVESEDFELAVSLLNDCLNLNSLAEHQKAHYLQARAWAHFNLNDFKQALQDQEASFKLREPTEYHEFINHAVYLRKMNRYLDTLDPLLKAEIIDYRQDRTSMMTQYNLGWSYYALGRFKESISAISRGIPQQPGYAFAYLRRGLAYDKIGKTFDADADFSKFVELLRGSGLEIPPDAFSEISELKEKYEILQEVL